MRTNNTGKNLNEIYKEIIDNEENNIPKDCNNFISLEGIDCNNTSIYRVFSVSRLLQLITEKKNTLVKPRMWDDPWENFLLNQTFYYDGNRVSFGEFRESFYGQCWTLNSSETDALWRIYSPNKNCIRIRTKISKLFDGFYDQSNKFAEQSYYMGKITYLSNKEIKEYYETPNNFSNVLNNSCREMIKTLLIKRKEFVHENELRLIYTHSDPDQKKEYLNNDVFQYDFNPLEIIEQIVFDPRFDDGEYKSFKKILINFGFKSKIIKKSDLYQIPKFNLILDS